MTLSLTTKAMLLPLAMTFFAMVSTQYAVDASPLQSNKVTLRVDKRTSGSPYRAYQAELNKRTVDGVFHLPLSRRRSRAGTKPAARRLSRRDQGTFETDISPIDLTVPITIDGVALNYGFCLTTEESSATNVADCPSCWDAEQSPNVQFLGKVQTAYGDEFDEYELNGMEIFGGLELDGIGITYKDSAGHQTERQGAFCLGLQGSGFYSNSQGRSTLDVLLGSNALAKPMFSVALGAGSVDDPGMVLLGDEIPPLASSSIGYSPSKEGRWALDVKINGHSGEADVSTDSNWITTPKDVASAIIKEVGLKEETDEDGNIVAKVDCQKGPDKDVTIELAGLTLVISQAAAVTSFGDDTCYFIIQGADQGKYPTPFTLGETIFLSYNVYFDLTDSQPQIGFALPDDGSD